MSRNNQFLAGPLTPAVLYILLALRSGEHHGYEIMKEVRSVSDGKITLGPGTLYGSIKRLLAAGLIAETEKTDDISSRAREDRRYYRITGAGKQQLATEIERLVQVLDIAEQMT